MIVETLMPLLQKYNVIELLFPFLLIYTIVYAILEKTGVLGKKAKAPNAVVALCIAAIVTFFTPFGISLIDFFTKIFTGTLVLVIGLILLIIFSTLISAAKGEEKRNWLIIIIAAVLAYLALSWSGILEKFPSVEIGKTIIPIGLVVVLAVLGAIGLIIWAISYQPKKESS
jgi:xanthine/uracil permease